MNGENRRALVTGASRGIGRAIALALARDGFRVAGTATTEAGAKAVELALAEAGYAGQGLVMDVNDTDSVSAAMASLEGAPLVLVNNAGITRDNLMMRMSLEDWNAVVSTNLTGAFLVSRHCLKAMLKARWGRILNIGSVIGTLGGAGQANYAAAKAGLAGFTRSLARELAPRSITVNAVTPGFIETDMTGTLDQAARDAIVQAVPLGRVGLPEEVAELVAFLAGDTAGYITGATLPINGGMQM